MVFLVPLPILKDNYAWILSNTDHLCVIVDPGESTPILHFLDRFHLIPTAILLTHFHDDHVGGVKKIMRKFSPVLYGPEEIEITNVHHQIVQGGETIPLLGRTFEVLKLPGHTIGHVGFYSKPWLFCGDTLFSAGCGRVFTGDFKNMYHSCRKINMFPEGTLICPAHEYTVQNLLFSSSILYDDAFISSYLYKMNRLRAENLPTVPSSLLIERRINLFLRCHDTLIKNRLSCKKEEKEWIIFSILRKKRDHFQ